jgi:hypothetical protein
MVGVPSGFKQSTFGITFRRRALYAKFFGWPVKNLFALIISNIYTFSAFKKK